MSLTETMGVVCITVTSHTPEAILNQLFDSILVSFGATDTPSNYLDDTPILYMVGVFTKVKNCIHYLIDIQFI